MLSLFWPVVKTTTRYLAILVDPEIRLMRSKKNPHRVNVPIVVVVPIVVLLL